MLQTDLDRSASWVIHLPHASTFIPEEVRRELLLSDPELKTEILRMTDHLTDELVIGMLPKAQRIRFPVCRLVVDPERFSEDHDEPMSRLGMGVIYERTSHGKLLRLPPSRGHRDQLIAKFYAPHHAAMERAVADVLEEHGNCSILDMHSFPSRALPYEFDQTKSRPDICIGTDEFHTPKQLVDELCQRFGSAGLRVAINRPFSGTMVPMRYFRTNFAVKSIMIEVNRGLYLNEATAERNESFYRVRDVLAKALETLPSYRED